MTVAKLQIVVVAVAAVLSVFCAFCGMLRPLGRTRTFSLAPHFSDLPFSRCHGYTRVVTEGEPIKS